MPTRKSALPQKAAAALLAATLSAALGASPALAQAFRLNKIEVNGLTSVPSAPLLAQLKDKPGDSITTNDVLADQDQLTKLLEAAHITGGVKTSLRNYPNGRKDIIFDVTDNGVQKPVVTTVALHIAHVSFTGAQYMTEDELAAAAAIKPGDVINDQLLADANTRVQAAYKKASNSKATRAGNTTITPQVTYPVPGQVDVAWVFKQTAAKKKRNTEDEGFKTE